MPSTKNYTRREIASPLQRKNRKGYNTRHGDERNQKPWTTSDGKPLGLFETQGGGTAYATPEHIPGIRHVVEGRSDLEYKAVQKARMKKQGGAKNSKDYAEVTTSQGRSAEAYNRGIDDLIAGFAAEDEARSRIKPIVDPDAPKLEARRRAAKRRRRGRTGTLLTDRETLG